MTDPVDGVWSRGRRGLTAALVASVTLVGSETLAVATVMPAVAADLGLGGYGLAFSLFAVGSIVGVLLAGPAADRWGPLRPFLLGMGVFAAGLAVGAGAGSITVLVAGRLLQGLGAGAIPAVGYTCIGRAYPEQIQPRMLAVLSTAWVLPGVIGPGLAGVVADRVGWRWVFGGLLPLVLVAVLAAVRPLAALGPPGAAAVAGARPLPVRDAVRFAAGVGLAIAVSGRLGSVGIGGGLIGVVTSVGAVVLAVAGGVVLARGPSRRLLPAGWWHARRGVAAAVAARGMVAYAFVATDAFVPLALTDVRGRSVTFASLAVSAGALVWSVGSWIADRVVATVGPARLAVRGAAVVAVGALWQLLLLIPAVPVAVAFPGVAVAALGMGMAFTPLAMLVLDQQEEPDTGRASSWLSLFEQLGFATGPLLGGILVGIAPQPPGLGQVLAVAFLVAAAVAASASLLGRRLQPVVPAVPPRR